MLYSVVDNAPNWGLRTKCYKNKGQAYLYAKNLQQQLPLGYTIHIDEVENDNGNWKNVKGIKMFHSIGNNKNVKIIKKK